MLDQNITICPMTAAHLDGVCEVELASFSTPWSRESFTYEVEKNPFAHYFVALCAGEVVAYGGMLHVIDEGQVTNIAVHPDFRRCGIGAALLDTLMAEAKKLEIAYMTLEVRSKNAAAIELYTKKGFSQNGRRPRYYHDPEDDALLLQLIF